MSTNKVHVHALPVKGTCARSDVPMVLLWGLLRHCGTTPRHLRGRVKCPPGQMRSQVNPCIYASDRSTADVISAPGDLFAKPGSLHACGVAVSYLDWQRYTAYAHSES